MTIYGLEHVASRGGQTMSSENKNIMGKNDFLHLLVAQLEAQDPLNPMDSTGFTAQLAQFSSLELLQNIDTTLGGLSGSQAVLTNSQAVGFIGKSITAVGNQIQAHEDGGAALQFDLDEDAAGIYAKIYDGQGNYINQIEVGATAAGRHSINWDGLDYLGGRAPKGNYTYEVSAIDELGNSVGVTTFASGTVTGVQYKDGQAFLQCDGREIALGNVVQVSAQQP